ncbi:DUF6429 family protein [Streptococcus sp. S784/96/1]|uniref:DUF6429 family protein n=1 Tax=Streptococcus sp. S784/96/1 TaxID=2653499 RepID=UPI0013873239|nr:DUF6429 family protein [Streptococcus sp. S784/96/1]
MVKRSAKQAQLDLTLALMYLNRFRERLPKSLGDVKAPYQSWKGYDFDVINQLDEDALIYQSSHRAKSITLTEDGIARAKAILSDLEIEDFDF